MTSWRMRAFGGRLVAFRRDPKGSSAVEFSIIAMPFIALILALIQMGIFYMTQSALNAGVNATADALVNTFYSATTTPVITQSYLTSTVTSKGGGLVSSSSTLLVDLEPFANLTAASDPIHNSANIGAPRNLLALRAQANVTSLIPGLTQLLTVRSFALVRRQAN